MSDSATTETIDSSKMTEAILCPRCGYDLRALPQPRCPECGYSFAWPDLLDPARRSHRYLFEHHPEKNFQSFLRTAIAQLLPRRFWRSIWRGMRFDRKRLIRYWLMLVAATLACYLAFVTSSAVALQINLAQERPRMAKYLTSQAPAGVRERIVGEYGSVEKYVQFAYPIRPTARLFELLWGTIRYESRQSAAFALPAAVVYWCWPWLTLLVLTRVFRQSLCRAGVGAGEVLRVVIYSSDAAIWFFAAFIIRELLLVREVIGSPVWVHIHFDSIAYRSLIFATAIGFAVVAMYRLAVACRLYLKLDHSLAVVLASQIIVALFCLAAIVYVPGVLEYMCQALFID